MLRCVGQVLIKKGDS